MNISSKPALPSRIHHIALKTAHFDQLREFYHHFLGFSPTLEMKGAIGFYTFDLIHHRLVIMVDPLLNSDSSAHTGMHHIAFGYDNAEQLMNVYQYLKSQNMDPFIMINHGPNTAMYYTDPDSNIIELQFDNHDNPQDALNFMAEVNQNPQRIVAEPDLMFMTVDPELYLKAYQSGATNHELHQRSYGGEFKTAVDPQKLPRGFNPAHML